MFKMEKAYDVKRYTVRFNNDGETGVFAVDIIADEMNTIVIEQLRGTCVKLSYLSKLIEDNLIPELIEYFNEKLIGYYTDYYTVNASGHLTFVERYEKLWKGNYKRIGAYSVYTTSLDKLIDGLSLPVDYFAALIEFLKGTQEDQDQVTFEITSVKNINMYTSKWLGEEDEAKRENEIDLLLGNEDIEDIVVPDLTDEEEI